MATGSTDYRSDPTLSSTASSSGGPGVGDRAKAGDDLDKAKSAAADAASTVKAEAAHVGQDLQAHGSELVGAAKDRAQGFVTEQKAAGADQVEGIARAAHKAAEELEQTSPHLAAYVRDAASAADDFADSMRNRSFGDILQDVTDYARREPVVFFGIALAAGFAASRFLKSTSEDGTPGDYGYSNSTRSTDWRSADYRSDDLKRPSSTSQSSYGTSAMGAAGSGAATTTPVAPMPSSPMQYPTGEVKTTDPMSSGSSSNKAGTGSTMSGTSGEARK